MENSRIDELFSKAMEHSSVATSSATKKSALLFGSLIHMGLLKCSACPDRGKCEDEDRAVATSYLRFLSMLCTMKGLLSIGELDSNFVETALSQPGAIVLLDMLTPDGVEHLGEKVDKLAHDIAKKHGKISEELLGGLGYQALCLSNLLKEEVRGAVLSN